MNETLEAMARAIFKSWFIDFDPVHRNIARRAGRNQPSPQPSPTGRGSSHYSAGYDVAGLVEIARELRRRQTPAEQILWELLRHRRFWGLKFRRQHQIGDYVADFYCHQHRLVVELDGPVHGEEMNVKKDAKRDAYLRSLGFTVLRFPNQQLIETPESVLRAIARTANPLPLGEGPGEGSVEGIEARLPSPRGRRVGVEGVIEGTAFDHLFPDSFQDSPLGKIPKGWQLDEIKNRCSAVTYGLTRSATKQPIGPRFLRITDIQGGRVNWSSVPFCQATEEEHQKYRVESGDIFVARTGASTGENVYIVNPPDAVFASYLVRFRFNDPSTARVVGAFMRTFAYFDYVAGVLGGSAQPNASAQVLAGATLVFPPTEVANRFAQILKPLDDLRRKNEEESHTLAAIRDALLPKLISGEIRLTRTNTLVSEVRRCHQEL